MEKIRHPAAAPKPEGSEAQETDWAHHIIIQHQLYAHPDAFTGVGEYPDYTQPFSDILAKAEESVQRLDLPENAVQFLDELVRLKPTKLPFHLFWKRGFIITAALSAFARIEFFSLTIFGPAYS